MNAPTGYTRGGFALLVATDMRILLVDKKPLNFLTVEDLRFDMINQIDYNHRLMGASVVINTGFKTLKFTSFNQPRLRKLIHHVQDRMSEMKKEQNEHQENQKQHLAAINQQLQAYLLAQHQQLMQFQQQNAQGQPAQLQAVKPSPELSDYLFAQSLMQQFKTQTLPSSSSSDEPPVQSQAEPQTAGQAPAVARADSTSDDGDGGLYRDGYQEVFGKQTSPKSQAAAEPPTSSSLSHYVRQAQTAAQKLDLTQLAAKSLEVNPLKVAYSKLPMMMRNRRFGRPSFHDHSHADAPAQAPTTQPAPQA